MKRSVLLLLPLAVLLAGCAASPDRDEVAERFLIEVTDSDTIRAGLTDLSLSIADDMLEGNCGSTAYEVGLSDPSLVYAWRVTCLTYFEGDLTEEQVAQTKQMIVERAAG